MEPQRPVPDGVARNLQVDASRAWMPPLADPAPSWPPVLRVDPSGGAGTDVQSPGTTLKLTYNLPPGTYALLCFVADDETGMPHAMMGMHEVVVLH